MITCLKCKNLDDVKILNHTCGLRDYQRFPFKLIGKRFISSFCAYKNKVTTYSGTIVKYTGYSEAPYQYFKYEPDENDSTKDNSFFGNIPPRYSFNINSQVFHRIKIKEKEQNHDL
jgi:hypothetical protein